MSRLYLHGEIRYGPGVLGVVLYYNGVAPNNVLTKYTSALQMVATAGTGSHTKIDAVGSFCADWKTAGSDLLFEDAQQHDFDVTAFDPARQLAIADGSACSARRSTSTTRS